MTSREKALRVITPEEPPALTLEAARLLLRILMEARTRHDAEMR